jgi:hypothetical protein
MGIGKTKPWSLSLRLSNNKPIEKEGKNALLPMLYDQSDSFTHKGRKMYPLWLKRGIHQISLLHTHLYVDCSRWSVFSKKGGRFLFSSPSWTTSLIVWMAGLLECTTWHPNVLSSLLDIPSTFETGSVPPTPILSLCACDWSSDFEICMITSRMSLYIHWLSL